MSNDFYSEKSESQQEEMKESFFSKNSFLINIVMVILTFLTTTIAGVDWMYGTGASLNLNNFFLGLPYSLSILFVLGCHEFGHYFASKFHKVKATLPYFIPIPFIPGFINFGTLGAVIKTKSLIPSRKALFDIGVSGPIAGFVACIILLIYGFSNLPATDYILRIHPNYFSNIKEANSIELFFGNNILYYFLQTILTDPTTSFVPPMSEMYHYPYLIVGWFGLFVTSMNLIPAGQLDGGHIFYAMFGKEVHLKIATFVFYILLALGLLGIASEFIEMPFNFGWIGWFLWAVIIKFVLKLPHPEIEYFEEKLDSKRMILGYFSIVIFIISFIPTPFFIKL